MPNSQAHNLAVQLGSIYRSQISQLETRFPSQAKTAQNLLHDNPVAYGNICLLLLDGVPYSKVAKLTHHHPDLVRFISQIHPEIQDALRNLSIQALSDSILTLASRLNAEAHLIPISLVPRALATATQQLALLTGHPTQHLQVSNLPSRDKLLQLFNELKNPLDLQDPHA